MWEDPVDEKVKNSQPVVSVVDMRKWEVASSYEPYYSSTKSSNKVKSCKLFCESEGWLCQNAHRSGAVANVQEWRWNVPCQKAEPRAVGCEHDFSADAEREGAEPKDYLAVCECRGRVSQDWTSGMKLGTYPVYYAGDYWKRLQTSRRLHTVVDTSSSHESVPPTAENFVLSAPVTAPLNLGYVQDGVYIDEGLYSQHFHGEPLDPQALCVGARFTDAQRFCGPDNWVQASQTRSQPPFTDPSTLALFPNKEAVLRRCKVLHAIQSDTRTCADYCAKNGKYCLNGFFEAPGSVNGKSTPGFGNFPSCNHKTVWEVDAHYGEPVGCGFAFVEAASSSASGRAAPPSPDHFFEPTSAICECGDAPLAVSSARYVAQHKPLLYSAVLEQILTEKNSTKALLSPCDDGRLFSNQFDGTTSPILRSCPPDSLVGSCAVVTAWKAPPEQALQDLPHYHPTCEGFCAAHGLTCEDGWDVDDRLLNLTGYNESLNNYPSDMLCQPKYADFSRGCGYSFRDVGHGHAICRCSDTKVDPYYNPAAIQEPNWTKTYHLLEKFADAIEQLDPPPGAADLRPCANQTVRWHEGGFVLASKNSEPAAALLSQRAEDEVVIPDPEYPGMNLATSQPGEQRGSVCKTFTDANACYTNGCQWVPDNFVEYYIGSAADAAHAAAHGVQSNSCRPCADDPVLAATPFAESFFYSCLREKKNVCECVGLDAGNPTGVSGCLEGPYHPTGVISCPQSCLAWSTSPGVVDQYTGLTSPHSPDRLRNWDKVTTEWRMCSRIKANDHVVPDPVFSSSSPTSGYTLGELMELFPGLHRCKDFEKDESVCWRYVVLRSFSKSSPSHLPHHRPHPCDTSLTSLSPTLSTLL